MCNKKLKDICEALVTGCWSKGSLEVFCFSLSIILSMDELSFLFHAESLNTQRHIFGFREVEENCFYFTTLFLGVLICWTCEMWDFAKWVSPCTSFCFQAQNHLFTSGKIDTNYMGQIHEFLHLFRRLFQTFCWCFFLLRQCCHTPHGTLRLPYSPQSPESL